MIVCIRLGRIGFIFMLVISLILGSRVAWATKPVPGAPVQLNIVAVNDFHGMLVEAGKSPGLAKLGRFIKDEKAMNPEGTIILSAGDMFQGSADSNLLYGKTVVDGMNEIGFDALVVGNHEFDWGIDILKQQIEQSKFPYLGANVKEKKSGKIPNFLKEYIILHRNGLNIGIIGITTPETTFKSAPKVVGSFHFVDPIQTVTEGVRVLRGQGADIVVVLSHLGCEVNQSTGEITGEAAELAKAVQGVDLLITGHSHQIIQGKVNGIPIMQAGYWGRAVGVCSMTYSTTDKAVVNLSISVVGLPTPGLAADPALTAIVNQSQVEIAPVKNKILGESAIELAHSRSELSALGQWSTDNMRRAVRADIAFQNGGGLRTSIPIGPITVGRMYEVMPFDNTLYVVNLTGTQVKEILKHGINNPNIGMVQFSGIIVHYNAAEQNVISVQTLDGRQLEAEHVYKVVTNDFMASGGDGYTTFMTGKQGYDTNLSLRDVLMDAVKKTRVIRFSPDERFKYIQEHGWEKAA